MDKVCNCDCAVHQLQWIKTTTPDGKTIYVNIKTRETSYEMPPSYQQQELVKPQETTCSSSNLQQLPVLPKDVLMGIVSSMHVRDLCSAAQVAKSFNVMVHDLRLKAILATRESMIEPCIESCKVFGPLQFTYGDIYNGCMRVFPLYGNRQKQNAELVIKDEHLNNLAKTWFYVLWTRNDPHFYTYNITVPFPQLNTAQETSFLEGVVSAMAQAIKDDLIETMKMYEAMYKREHPRKKEIEQLQIKTKNYGG